MGRVHAAQRISISAILQTKKTQIDIPSACITHSAYQVSINTKVHYASEKLFFLSVFLLYD